MVTIVAYYVFGIPTGVALAFRGFGVGAGLGLNGLWVGLTLGSILMSTGLGAVFLSVDWDKASAEARARALTTKAPEGGLEPTLSAAGDASAGDDASGGDDATRSPLPLLPLQALKAKLGRGPRYEVVSSASSRASGLSGEEAELGTSAPRSDGPAPSYEGDEF